MERTLTSFLEEARISKDDWEKADIDWEVLQEIGADHDEQRKALTDAADLYARTLQGFESVHSVRWRVKDTSHVLEKIVRKRLAKNEKYGAINAATYRTTITDLVGVRALHLFKADCFAIDSRIRNTFELAEQPVAYVRKGDHEAFRSELKTAGFEVMEHKDGYRSVHYVVSSQPVGRRVLAELQVRTVFEEGWSEIDHRVRYPNFSSNELVNYFLNIFNKMAGNADEMGSYVQALRTVLADQEDALAKALRDREKSLLQMEDALAQLKNAREQDANYRDQIARLELEVAKLRPEVGLWSPPRSSPTFGAPSSSSPFSALLGPIPPASALDSLSSLSGSASVPIKSLLGDAYDFAAAGKVKRP
jgi:putative GTP pyrophosphokinase